MVEIAKIVIKVGGQEIAMTPEDILDNFLPRQTIPPPVIGHRAPWPFTDDLSLVLVRRKADDTIIIKLIASDVEHKAPNPLVVTSGVVA